MVKTRNAHRILMRKHLAKGYLERLSVIYLDNNIVITMVSKQTLQNVPR
jgi:hypothetical protein